MNTQFKLAILADRAFKKALKKQFGPKASRWDYPTHEYNAETLAAYHAKVKADDINLKTLLQGGIL